MRGAGGVGRAWRLPRVLTLSPAFRVSHLIPKDRADEKGAQEGQ